MRWRVSSIKLLLLCTLLLALDACQQPARFQAANWPSQTKPQIEAAHG